MSRDILTNMGFKNFISHIVNLFLAKEPGRKKSHIYNKIEGMTRQDFYDLTEPGRTPSPFKWRDIRIATGMSRTAFWKEAMEFHDPAEDIKQKRK